mgnify:CR=1 FL=1
MMIYGVYSNGLYILFDLRCISNFLALVKKDRSVPVYMEVIRSEKSTPTWPNSHFEGPGKSDIINGFISSHRVPNEL